jgi:hypothetical protein
VGISGDNDRERAARLSRALGNPLRVRVLTAVHERGPISSPSLSREFELGNPTDIRYHVSMLEHLQAVELAERRPVDGHEELLFGTTPFGEEVVAEIKKREDSPPAAD